jgi:hypothetical protein
MKTDRRLEKLLHHLDKQDLRSLLCMAKIRLDRYRSLDGSIRSNLVLKKKDGWRDLPLPIRFSLMQAAIMFLMITQYPPVDRLPHIILPITWCGSLAMTVTLYGFIIPQFRRLVNS